MCRALSLQQRAQRIEHVGERGASCDRLEHVALGVELVLLRLELRAIAHRPANFVSPALVVDARLAQNMNPARLAIGTGDAKFGLVWLAEARRPLEQRVDSPPIVAMYACDQRAARWFAFAALNPVDAIGF